MIFTPVFPPPSPQVHIFLLTPPLFGVFFFKFSMPQIFIFIFFKEDYVTADTLVLWPSQSSHFLFWNVPQAVGVSIVLLMY